MSRKAIYYCEICSKQFWEWSSREDPEGILVQPSREMLEKQTTVNKPIWFTLSWKLDICDTCLGYYLREFLIKTLKTVHTKPRFKLDDKYHPSCYTNITNEINELIDEVKRDLNEDR